MFKNENAPATAPQYRFTCTMKGETLFMVMDVAPASGERAELPDGGIPIAIYPGYGDQYYHMHVYERHGKPHITLAEMIGLGLAGGVPESFRALLVRQFAPLSVADCLVPIRDAIAVVGEPKQNTVEARNWKRFIASRIKLKIDLLDSHELQEHDRSAYLGHGYVSGFQWILFTMSKAFELLTEGADIQGKCYMVGETYTCTLLPVSGVASAEVDGQGAACWKHEPCGVNDKDRPEWAVDVRTRPRVSEVDIEGQLAACSPIDDGPTDADAERMALELGDASTLVEPSMPGLDPANREQFLGTHTYDLVASMFNGHMIRSIWLAADDQNQIDCWMLWCDLYKALDYAERGNTSALGGVKEFNGKRYKLKIEANDPRLDEIIRALKFQAQNSQDEEQASVSAQNGLWLVNTQGLLQLGQRSNDPARRMVITQLLDEVVYKVMKDGKYTDPGYRKAMAKAKAELTKRKPKKTNPLRASFNELARAIGEDDLPPEFCVQAANLYKQAVEAQKKGTFSPDSLQRLIDVAQAEGTTVDQLIVRLLDAHTQPASVA